MINRLRFTGMILLVLSVPVFHSCKKDKTSPPVVSTASITDITRTTAVSGGNITNDGGAAVTSKGICWNTTGNPSVSDSKTNDGAGSGIFASNLTQLQAGTLYHVRAYAINSAGTGYGAELTFTSDQASVADVTTTGPTSVTLASAVSGGNIISDNGAAITAKGICWATTKYPTTNDSKTNAGAGSGSFTGSITGLLSETVYYIRAYATNSVGTSYGNQVSFKTFTGTVSDINGNTYYTIAIGSQVWMAENLKATKFRNNDPIPEVGISVAWDTVVTPASCTNSFMADYASVYGRLYNWYAVSDSRGICPAGWHVSTDPEWTQLTDYLGGANIAGLKLKESGTVYWNVSDSLVTNESGFTGRPGAFRSKYAGIEVMPGDDGAWWTSTEFDQVHAWNRWLSEYDASVSRTDNAKTAGFSVRCVKD
jgi:uncharacterized protein (TIGR02145 family)